MCMQWAKQKQYRETRCSQTLTQQCFVMCDECWVYTLVHNTVPDSCPLMVQTHIEYWADSCGLCKLNININIAVCMCVTIAFVQFNLNPVHIATCMYDALGCTTVSMRIITCSGKMLTLNCTVNSTSHIWNITALNSLKLVNRFERNVFDPRYTISITDSESTNSIISSLSLMVTDDFNGTTITCLDTFSTQIMQETAITVLGTYDVLIS